MIPWCDVASACLVTWVVKIFVFLRAKSKVAQFHPGMDVVGSGMGPAQAHETRNCSVVSFES